VESDFSLLWMIIFLPALLIGVVCGFFPHKVIQFRAKIEENLFRSFNMNDEDIDKSIYSTIFGESYSKRLEAQQQRPKKSRFLMIWVRLLGFIILFVVIITISLVIIAAWSGNLIIQ
jgi:hypothetical protein